MEPRIQYAQTADGVSIAFWTLGEGIPLVWIMALPFSHVQLEWQMPGIRRWYERLAQRRKLVRYDGRGSGLSDRDVTDYSLDAHVLDLEAVVDRLGLEQFDLFAIYHGGPVAIAYAARHPERVSHLVLWCSWARGSDVAGSPLIQTMRGFIRQNWETYTETAAGILLGWSEPESAHQFAAFLRESVTPEAAQAALEAIASFDVADLLPQLRTPTLVLHRRELRFPDAGVARGLASHIPDASLVVLEGASIAPHLGDTEAALRAVSAFFGEAEEPVTSKEPPGVGAVHTILFSDVEGSTSLTERLGDAKAREVLRTYERIVRDALRAHGGSEVKSLGDGFMASFSSGTRALECAIAIQRAFADYNAALLRQAQDEHTEPVEVRVRIGLNAGEPIAEEEDLFGTAVNMAARIADQAEGGEILVANVVRELAAGKGFLFVDRGEVIIRGFEDPVRLYEVRWEA
jgi:class 3 adenylate cyclase/pimeloyl-ACP methyl ester carboxylesterase